MKTNIFLSLLVAAFLFTVNAGASNPEKKVLNNVETTELGDVKEMISLNKDTSEPETKVVYYYNPAGELQKKIMYKWSAKKGWTGYRKYDYVYNDKGLVSNMIYTEWDKKAETWSNKSVQHIHVYDDNGKFFAMKKIDDYNRNSYFLAEN